MTTPSLSNDCFALPPGIHWTPVDEALSLLQARLGPVVGVETVPIGAAMGRILARGATARRANPPTANSAVDGYAFSHKACLDGGGALPLVEGRAAAGAGFRGTVPPGHAIRILTGAPLPEGVDTVVLQEDVALADGVVRFKAGLKPGANARKAGEDVAEGAALFPAGHCLAPQDLALLAASGTADIQARQVLRVGVLSTGDEIVSPGQAASAEQIYDANRPLLLAILARWGYRAVDLGHVGDDADALAARLDQAADSVDAILTSGGASAGDEDHLSALLQSRGKVHSWRIALKPGRPLALGQWRDVPVFGLPGNPVAAFVCTLIFARPALHQMAGGQWLAPMGVMVPAAFSKSKKAGRREYLRARLTGDGRVELFRSEGSGRISGLSWADGLVELGDAAAEIVPGDPVMYRPYAAFGL